MIGFIARNLPVLDASAGEWDHMFTSAYQMGWEALAALDVAEETDRGARPLPRPQLPEILPRWDDICAVVLGLAEQRGLLSYRLPDGRESPETAAWWGRRKGTVLASPNIDAAHGLGRAHAAPTVLSVLECLGLVRDHRWTVAAETVFWREQPTEWGMNITSDPRFQTALERAITAMPGDIRADLDRLVTITDADVAEGRAKRRAHQQLHTEHGPSRVISLPLTSQSVREGLTFLRRHELDWLFYRNWRLHDGWLGPDERSQAMAIFHDPLAIMMRQAVIAKLYPELSELAQ